jgi:hypothetical protein
MVQLDVFVELFYNCLHPETPIFQTLTQKINSWSSDLGASTTFSSKNNVFTVLTILSHRLGCFISLRTNL